MASRADVGAVEKKLNELKTELAALPDRIASAAIVGDWPTAETLWKRGRELPGLIGLAEIELRMFRLRACESAKRAHVEADNAGLGNKAELDRLIRLSDTLRVELVDCIRAQFAGAINGAARGGR